MSYLAFLVRMLRTLERKILQEPVLLFEMTKSFWSGAVKIPGAYFTFMFFCVVLIWPVSPFGGGGRWVGLLLWAVVLLASGSLIIWAVRWARSEWRQVADILDGEPMNHMYLQDDREKFEYVVRNCCWGDRRISGYFDRGFIEVNSVVNSLCRGDAFSQAIKVKSYGNLNNVRYRYDYMDDRNSSILDQSLVNAKSISIIILWILLSLLAMWEVGESSSLDILLSYGVLVPGTISAVCLSRFTGGNPKNYFLLSGAALGLIPALAAVILPYVYGVSGWMPAEMFFLGPVAVTLAWLFSRDPDCLTKECRDLVVVCGRKLVQLPLDYLIDRLQEEWASGCVEDIIIPYARLTINTLLGDSKDRLLVEQDSEGLRRLQDIELTVATKSERRISDLLAQMDGGSIGLAGPRGAGKTTLLKKFVGPGRVFLNEGSCLSVYLAAPAEYIPRDFLVSLFQRLCEEYLNYAGYPLPGPIYRARRTVSIGDIVARFFGIMWLGIRTVVGIWIIQIVATSIAKPGLHELMSTAPVHLMNAYRNVEHYLYAHVYKEKRNWDFAWPILLAIAAMVLPGVRLWVSYIKPRAEPELVQMAREYLLRLQVEKTVSWGVNVTFPSVRGSGSSVSRGGNASYVPWAFPEIVEQVRKFISAVSEEFKYSSHAVLVGIDEIDRIGSVDHAEKFIGEIKAIFGVERCFFIVSVAEDVGSVFSQRSTSGRSIVENAFDNVISVGPLDFNESRELLAKRVLGFTNPFVYLVHALSGGLPRELIRATRRLMEVNHSLNDSGDSGKPVRLESLAFVLVAEQLAQEIEATRKKMACLALHPSWANFFEEIRSVAVNLQRPSPVSIGDSYYLIERLSSIEVPETPGNRTGSESAGSDDEVEAKQALLKISAFAYFCMTVIDAFSVEYFDFTIVETLTGLGAPGSYEELSVIREEMSVSPGGSRVLINKFRNSLGLLDLS